MSSRTRALVLSITAPVIVFALVGGVLGRAMGARRNLSAPQDFRRRGQLDFEQLRRAREPRQGDEGRDERPRRLRSTPTAPISRPSRSSSSNPAAPLPPGDIGLELTRQYYLRVIAARDNSPAAKAGLRTGRLHPRDQRRADARHVVWEGTRALRGAAGIKVTLTVFRGNAADPHDVELTREVLPAGDVTARIAGARRRLRSRRRRSAPRTAIR